MRSSLIDAVATSASDTMWICPRPASGLPPAFLPVSPLPTRSLCLSATTKRTPTAALSRAPRRSRSRPPSKRLRHTNDTKPPFPPLTSSERLHKVLSHMGVASRRSAEQLILANRVTVNGLVVSDVATCINPRVDRVTVDGSPVALPRTAWLAVHKPPGVLSVATSSSRSVLSLAPEERRPGLVAVAPIEEDASGIVILTNDRSCVNTLSRPDNQFVKEWVVDCEGIASRSALSKLERGISLDEPDGKNPASVLVADVRLIGSGSMEIGPRRSALLTRFEVRIRDSRRQVVRRMFEAAGLKIFRASRKSFGPVLLGSLKRGDSRTLTSKEIRALKRGISEKTTVRKHPA